MGTHVTEHRSYESNHVVYAVDIVRIEINNNTTPANTTPVVTNELNTVVPSSSEQKHGNDAEQVAAY